MNGRKEKGSKKVWEEKNEKNIQFNSLDPSKTEIPSQYIKLTLHYQLQHIPEILCFLGENIQKSMP
jgi:hypothetical protein